MTRIGHPWQFNSTALDRMQRDMREMEKAAAQARNLDAACERLAEKLQPKTEKVKP